MRTGSLDPSAFESLTPQSVRGQGLALARKAGAKLSAIRAIFCGNLSRAFLPRAPVIGYSHISTQR